MGGAALWITLLWAIPFAGNLAAQQGWDQLETLAPAAELRILLKDGKQLNGRLNSWSTSEVAVTSSKGLKRDVNIAEVSRIWKREKGSRWKSAAIGAAIGFGIGFAIGAPNAGYVTDRNDPGWTTRVGIGAGFGIFSGGIGAGLGALAGGSRYVTVYRWR